MEGGQLVRGHTWRRPAATRLGRIHLDSFRVVNQMIAGLRAAAVNDINV